MSTPEEEMKVAFTIFRNLVWEVAEDCRTKASIGIQATKLPDVFIDYLDMQNKINNIVYIMTDAFVPGTEEPAQLLTVFKDFELNA